MNFRGFVKVVGCLFMVSSSVLGSTVLLNILVYGSVTFSEPNLFILVPEFAVCSFGAAYSIRFLVKNVVGDKRVE